MYHSAKTATPCESAHGRVFFIAASNSPHPEDGGDENLMRVMLDYGRSGMAVDVPDDRLVGPLAVREVSPLEDPSAAVATALERPIGAPAAAGTGGGTSRRLHRRLRHHAKRNCPSNPAR